MVKHTRKALIYNSHYLLYLYLPLYLLERQQFRCNQNNKPSLAVCFHPKENVNHIIYSNNILKNKIKMNE
jgi:hypothetical protein